MTGIISSTPPVVGPPPSPTSGSTVVLGPLTYTPAIPTLPQTWTALQTFLTGTIELSGSTSGNTFLNATAIASGTLTLPAATDTIVARNTVDTLTNKTLTSPIINGATISGSSIAIHSTGTGNFDLSLLNSENLTAGRSLTLTVNDANRTLNMGGNITTVGAIATGGALTTAGAFTISGSFGTTLTVTGTTAVTLPTAGTLATLAGVEALTNKTINGNTFTSGTYTLTGVAAKTLTFNNSLTLAGTDGTTQTFQASDTIVGRATTDTLTNKTLASPAITGAAITTSTYNGNTWTAGTGTLTIAAGKTLTANNSITVAGVDAKTLTVNNSLTLAGTDATTQTFPSTSGTIVSSVTAAGGDLTGTYPSPTVAANAITNAKMATMAAYTFKANNTGSAATPTDITIDGLTAKASPAAADEMIIWDVAGTALKKATVSSIASAGSVSSIAGNTGAFTLSTGITNSTNDIRLASIADKTVLSNVSGGSAAPSANNLATVGSSKVLLSAQTASSSASITFDSTMITSTYDSYEIELHSVLPATNTVSLVLTVSDDNGSTYKSTSYQWARQIIHAGSATISGAVNAAASNIAVIDSVADSNTGRPLSGKIQFWAPAAAASRIVQFKSQIGGLSSNLGGTFTFEQLTNGVYGSALSGILNNIKLAFSSGNIASGSFLLYGHRKS